jgi:hypothetical protein
VKKPKNISYSECVSTALVIQRAMCMRCIFLSVALPYFSTLPHNRYDFREGGRELLNKKCDLIFSTNSVCDFFFHSRETERVIINVVRSSCKVPVVRVRL